MACVALSSRSWWGDRTYKSNVPIYCLDPAVCTRDEEFGVDKLLDGEDNAILALDANRGAAASVREGSRGE